VGYPGAGQNFAVVGLCIV